MIPVIRLAGCIIKNNNGEILLIHRHKNGKDQWETPGGKVEPGETDIHAAVRELQEEIGLTVTIHHKLGEGDFSEAGQTYHYIWFEATIPDAPLTLESGFDDYAFVAYTKLKNLHLSAGTKKFIEVYLSHDTNHHR